MPTLPVVVHVLYRFEFGGLQSLLVECIRRTAGGDMRHVIVCVADADAEARLALGEVELIELNKPARGTWSTHISLFKTLKRLRPAVVQTYNIGAIEYIVTATLAGVPLRVHAEHGRGMVEYQGQHKKYNRLRRCLSPLIDTFVTVSDDLVAWLRDTVHIPSPKVVLIKNGIDLARCAPAATPDPARIIIGTVGRLDAIKAQADLIDAFLILRARRGASAPPLSLAIIGEGPLAGMLGDKIRNAAIGDCVWMPGARGDIAAIMCSLAVFVLPSLSEGTPMTLLEAMACGVPVVATAVGGVPALIGNNERGLLVAPSDPQAIADAIERFLQEPATARACLDAARVFVAQHYDINTTAAAYQALYMARPA